MSPSPQLRASLAAYRGRLSPNGILDGLNRDGNLHTIAEAQAINARSAGWAFALSEIDWGTLTTPLSALVE